MFFQMPQPTKSTDESNERFDLEEAKREMAEADKVDKAAYRAKMSRLRKVSLCILFLYIFHKMHHCLLAAKCLIPFPWAPFYFL